MRAGAEVLMYHGERFNSITHLVGTVLALIGVPFLVIAAARSGEAIPVVSVSIFGSTLVLLYLLSTLYHSVRGRAKELFQKLDHLAIYLLIAGTYTPVALVALGGTAGWTIFGVNWGLALVGIVVEFIPWKYSRVISHILYVAMGWLALVALGSILRGTGVVGGTLILAGGILYTAGIGFYAWKRLPHHHGIWHLFVLGGSICHYVAILLLVG
ncbi:MAG TPA: hemolysin III family protein [Candidatus Polarisedimenticolaceae bacterium]